MFTRGNKLGEGRPSRNRETLKAYKRLRMGKGSITEYEDVYYQSYGFKNAFDFRKSARLTVLKMLALKVNHPYYSSGYSMQYRVDLIKKYQYINIELKCACCGQVKDYHFMTIDHLNNNGAEHKKVGGFHNIPIYVLGHGIEEKYKLAIMCWDCNASLAFYGFCPHHPEIKREVKVGKRINKLDSIKSQNQLQESPKLKSFNLAPG